MSRVGFVLVVAACAALALYAGNRVRRWRQAEEENRLRRIHTLTGNVVRHDDFRSELLGAERRVWVYLPPQYETRTERRFAVLYMHDGQNVFDGATAFLPGKEWQADETAERLIREGRIEPLVIVAVDNAAERRTDEYTPTADARAGGGSAALYGRMLVEELKPWVDRTYRTRPGREDTGLAGSSLGGLVSLWVGLTHADTFGKIAALSTSAWWDEGFVLRFVESLPEKPDTRIWTDMGTREGGPALEAARRLRDALGARGWQEGADLRYVEAHGATHDEPAWAQRLPAVLEFLYPPVAGASSADPDGARATPPRPQD